MTPTEMTGAEEATFSARIALACLIMAVTPVVIDAPWTHFHFAKVGLEVSIPSIPPRHDVSLM